MTGADLKRLRAAFALAAQAVYDSWHQDGDDGECQGEDLGVGGICDRIANAMGEVIDSDAGYVAGGRQTRKPAGWAPPEWVCFNASVGSNHTWVVVKTADGVWSVDIPWWVYEQGGGYCWRKIPDVVFTVDDVEIRRVSADPADFAEYAEDGW